MTVFFNVLPPDEARSLIRQHLKPLEITDLLLTSEALDRVTGEAVCAPHPLPTFRRSTMDGYAVKAADTFGAGSALPAFLHVVGEVVMGRPATIELGTGEAAIIHTGGELPQSADAVVQVENTQPVGDEEIEVVRAVAVGENVIQVGEDIAEGEEILPARWWLRPQDLGGLLALGIVQVTVVRRPRVALISTGDEVVAPSEPMGPGQVRDINSYTTAALAGRAGAEPILYGVIPDDLDAMRAVAARAMEEADVIVFSAGSSVSVRDATARVIEELGEPGILFHGVAVRPGKPTIGAIAQGKPVFGLPGNPVSAMNLFDLLVVPTLLHLTGCVNPPRPAMARARVARNVPGMAGREDRVPVRLALRDGELWAEPVFGKSNLIFTLVRADGTFIIPLDAGGVSMGDWVDVQLYDG